MGLFNGSSGKKECDKAAQILKNFISQGKIPTEAIIHSKGLAIFSGIRAGMYLAGSGGSGVVVARLSDGIWSPPSAFSVRSGGIGLVGGVDLYECVCVLNTQAAVDAYSKPEMKIGGTVAGPVGSSANMNEVKPVWTYTKSRGLYGGVTVDGTVIKEKPDANADFYGSEMTAAQILQGNIQFQDGSNKWPKGAEQLNEVLKLAEGKGTDAKILQEIGTEPTPGELKES